jgi:hypothetical protein
MRLLLPPHRRPFPASHLRPLPALVKELWPLLQSLVTFCLNCALSLVAKQNDNPADSIASGLDGHLERSTQRLVNRPSAALVSPASSPSPLHKTQLWIELLSARSENR